MPDDCRQRGSERKEKEGRKRKERYPCTGKEENTRAKRKKEKEPEKIEITENGGNPEMITPSEDTEVSGAIDSGCQTEKEEVEFPEWEE